VPSKAQSAEVRIKFAMLSSQCKAAREWETSTTIFILHIWLRIF
jgi:hypothetical protein